MSWDGLPVVLATEANVAVLGQLGLRRSQEGRWELKPDFEEELARQAPRHEDALAGLSLDRLRERLITVLATIDRVWPAGDELDLALFRGPRLAGSSGKKGERPCLALHVDLVAGREEALAEQALEDTERALLLELAIVHEALHVADPDRTEAEVLGEQRPWLEDLEEKNLGALKEALRKVERRREGSRPFLGYVEACTAQPVMEPLVDFAVQRAVEASEPFGCRYSGQKWGDELTLGPYLAAKVRPGYSKLLEIRRPGDVIGGLWTLPASVVSTLMLFGHALFNFHRERAAQRGSAKPVGQTLAEMRERHMPSPFKVTTNTLTAIGVILGVLAFFSEPLLPLIPNTGNGLIRWLGFLPGQTGKVQDELVARRDIDRVASYLPEGWRGCVAAVRPDEPVHHERCRANGELPGEDETLLRDLLAELRDAPSGQDQRKAVRLASALLSAPTTSTGRDAAVEALRSSLLSMRTRPVAIEELEWLLGLDENTSSEPAAAAGTETKDKVAEMLLDVADTSEDRDLRQDLGPPVARLFDRPDPNPHRLKVLRVVSRLPIETWQKTVERWIVKIIETGKTLDGLKRSLLDLAGELASRNGAEERRFATFLVRELLRLETEGDNGSPDSKRVLATLEQLLRDSGVGPEAASHLVELVKTTPSDVWWSRDVVRILANSSDEPTREALDATLTAWSDPDLYGEAYETALSLVDSRRSDERSAGLARLGDLARKGDPATRARVFEEVANQITSSNPEPAIRTLRSLLQDRELRPRIQGEKELTAIARALAAEGAPGATLESELRGLVASIQDPHGLAILAPGLVAAARQQADGGMSLLDALLDRSEELESTFEAREAFVAPFLHYLVDHATRLDSAHGDPAKERLREIASDSAVRAVLPVLFDESEDRQNLAAEILREILPCRWTCFEDGCIKQTTRRWVLETMESKLAERPDGVPARTLVEGLLPSIALDFPAEERRQVVKLLLTLVRESPDPGIRERAIELLGGAMSERRMDEEVLGVLRTIVLGSGDPAPPTVRIAALRGLLDEGELWSYDVLQLIGPEPTAEDWSVHLAAWKDRRPGSDLLESLLWEGGGRDYFTGLLLQAGSLSELPKSLRPPIFSGYPLSDLPEETWKDWFGCTAGEESQRAYPEPKLTWTDFVVPWLAHPDSRVQDLGRTLVKSCMDRSFRVAMGFESGETDRFDSPLEHPLLLGFLAGSGLVGEDLQRSQVGGAVWRATTDPASDLAQLKESFLKTFNAGWDLAQRIASSSSESELSRGLALLGEEAGRELVAPDDLHSGRERWRLREWAESRILASALSARYSLAQPRASQMVAGLDGSMALLGSPGVGSNFPEIESLLLQEISSVLQGLALENPEVAADQVEKLFQLYYEHIGVTDPDSRFDHFGRSSEWPEAYLETAITAYEEVVRSAPSAPLSIPEMKRVYGALWDADSLGVLRRLIYLAFEIESSDLVELAATLLRGIWIQSWQEEQVILDTLQEVLRSLSGRPQDPAFAEAREQLTVEAMGLIFWSSELDGILAYQVFGSFDQPNREIEPSMARQMVDAVGRCPLGELPQTRRILLEHLVESQWPVTESRSLTPFTTDEMVELLGELGRLRRGMDQRSSRDDERLMNDRIRTVVAMYHAGEPLTDLRRLFEEIEQGGDWRSRLLDQAMKEHDREVGWLAAMKGESEAAQRACANLLAQESLHRVTLEIARSDVQKLLPPACKRLADEPFFCLGFGNDDNALRVPSECVVQLGAGPDQHCGRQLLWRLADRCNLVLEEGLKGHPDLDRVVEMIRAALADAEPSSFSQNGILEIVRQLRDSNAISWEVSSRLRQSVED